MRADIIFENNYIKSLKSSPTGAYELPQDFDMEVFSCYYLDGTELVLDITKANNVKQVDSAHARISTLKKYLADTDYIMAESWEEIMGLSNPLTWVADVIKITLKYTQQYATVISNRKAWRKEIENLEKEINK